MAYTYLIRAPVGTKRNNNKEAIFKEIIADNFSQQMNHTHKKGKWKEIITSFMPDIQY